MLDSAVTDKLGSVPREKGTAMHAVIVKVTIQDEAAAQSALTSDVVPRVSAAPGFVAGYWVSLPGGKGTGTIVFDSESAARTVSQQVQTPPPGAAVTVDSVEVGEVVANA